jgi:REP element-mobilizing transposase RayT
MTFDSSKHHRHSIRIQEFDYSSNGCYFITICTKNNEHHFGKIQNGKIILSDVGEIVYDEWIKTKQIRENIDLDLFAIMPNHFHGIVIIYCTGVGACRGVGACGVRAYCNTPLRQRGFQSPSNNLGAIVRSFKSSVKRRCNQNGLEHFEWQRNYYEHVVRNENDLARIREYIVNNPLKWELDKNTPLISPAKILR